ncbi:E3 ubiquitin-protein ligase RNF31-like [Polymixia lowei]
MSSSEAASQLVEVKRSAMSHLSSSGSAQDVKAEVQAMANLPLPLSEKYHHVTAEAMVRENTAGNNRQQVTESMSRLVKALSILEKYGCNLTSPTRPRYWRSVKHNNPVFRETVDAMKGGRGVLYLYGYTNQQLDGLSFPDDVTDPDGDKVAAVTLEVMTLRLEMDMLIKGSHPHPELYKDIIPLVIKQDELLRDAVVILPEVERVEKVTPSPALPLLAKPDQGPEHGLPPKPSTAQCNLCGGVTCMICPSCGHLPFCEPCDSLFHRHPSRTNHKRDRVQKTKHEWECRSCTVMNQGSSVLCEVCERPRLATRPSITSVPSAPGSLSDTATEWTCQVCTYANLKPVVVCEMCSSPCKDLPAVPRSLLQTPSPTTEAPRPRPQPKPRVSLVIKRQKLMREDGLKLIHQIREAEKGGVSPEEVYAALCVCGGSNINPCDWLTSELPHLLDEICAMAASVQLNYNAGDSGGPDAVQADGQTPEQHSLNVTGGGIQLSRAEAKQAWLVAAGDTEKAVKQLLRDRQAKMKELRSLGFREEARCEEALRLSGGEVKGALSHLQRPLLEPFHQRIWTEQPEAPFDPQHPDKQRMCRRLLALYDLPSWGRCELALSLLQEPDISYSLEDVVQAVKESHDRDFIRRLLNNECPCCLGVFPRSKMQSLTSCQCSVCHDCFTQHFTIAVRDKHIRDMVCPVCAGPDINDPEQLDSYFSTLDIQLRDCLDPDVYELYHHKLTEHALRKDPKFLWCCHCTSGFINDGDQLKVTCPSCHKSFCAQCKKPWEPQHQDLSCEKFQQWKRENDPECQKQGLAGYLRDNGITCPHCRFPYALTKGGCMHFTCFQCRYQFCSGCNNPFHTTACKTAQCKFTGLHAHHPRDCLFYLRDWDPPRLQALLQRNNVEFNTDPPDGTQADACGVMEQKDEGGQQIDSPCGIQTQPGQAGLCEKHYKEYMVSLINGHTLDPALLYDSQELTVACGRYQVDTQKGENEDDDAHHARLLQKLMEVPLGENVPRVK